MRGLARSHWPLKKGTRAASNLRRHSSEVVGGKLSQKSVLRRERERERGGGGCGVSEGKREIGREGGREGGRERYGEGMREGGLTC
jgi:hypothetical protein